MILRPAEICDQEFSDAVRRIRGKTGIQSPNLRDKAPLADVEFAEVQNTHREHPFSTGFVQNAIFHGENSGVCNPDLMIRSGKQARVSGSSDDDSDAPKSDGRNVGFPRHPRDRPPYAQLVVLSACPASR